jgi:hypothetical protein
MAVYRGYEPPALPNRKAVADGEQDGGSYDKSVGKGLADCFDEIVPPKRI